MRFFFVLSFLFIIAGNIFPQTLSQTDSSNDYGGTYKLLQLFGRGNFNFHFDSEDYGTASLHISYDGNTVLVQDGSSLRIFRRGSDDLYERVQLIISENVFFSRYPIVFTGAYMSLDSSTIITTLMMPNASSRLGYITTYVYRKNDEGSHVKFFSWSESKAFAFNPDAEIFTSSNGDLVIINMPYNSLEDFPDSEIERFFEEDDIRNNDYFDGYEVFGEEIFTLVFDENTGEYTRKQVLARTPYLLTEDDGQKKLRFSAIHPNGKFIKTYNKKEIVWKRQKNNTYKEAPNYQKDPDYLDYIERKGTNYEEVFSSYTTNEKERVTATDYQVDVLAISPHLKEDFVNILGEPRTRYIPGKIMDIWERGKDGSYKKIQTIDNGEPIEEIVISGDGKTIISASENILKAWVRVE